MPTNSPSRSRERPNDLFNPAKSQTSKALDFVDEERHNYVQSLPSEQREDIATAAGSGMTFGVLNAVRGNPDTSMYGRDALRSVEDWNLPKSLRSVAREFGEEGLATRFGRPLAGAGLATYFGRRLTNNMLEDERIYERPPQAPPSNVRPQVAPRQPVNREPQASRPNVSGPTSIKAASTKEASFSWLDDMASFFRRGGDEAGNGAFASGSQASDDAFDEVPDFYDAMNEYSRRADAGEVPHPDDLEFEELNKRINDIHREQRLGKAEKKINSDSGYQWRQSARNLGESVKDTAKRWTPNLGVRDTLETAGGAAMLGGAGYLGNFGYRASQPDVVLPPSERRRQEQVDRIARNGMNPAGPVGEQIAGPVRQQPRYARPQMSQQPGMQKQSSEGIREVANTAKEHIQEVDPLTMAMGSGLMVTQGPAATKALGGGAMYHGTSTDNLPSIVDEGLKLDYAGKQKRLNSQMMENALVEFISENDDSFSFEEDTPEIRDRFQEIDPDTEGGYADNLVRETQDIIEERTGTSPSPDEINDFLKGRGRRLYFGYAPHTVVDWGSDLNEFEMMGKAQKAMAGEMDHMKALRPLLDTVLTGGMYGVGKDEVAPAVRHSMSKMDAPVSEFGSDNVQMQVDRVLGRNASKNLAPVLKVHPTGKNMKSFGVFNDFPGLSGLMSASYSLKDTIRDLGIPNWSPGRDLSFADNVDPHQIEEVQFVDRDTGEVAEVMRNSDFRRPSRIRRIAGGLPRAGFPLALAGLGAGLFTKGVTGKGPIDRGKDRFGYGENEEKTAANLQTEALRRGVRYALPAMGAAVPAIAGTKYMSDKMKERGASDQVAEVGTGLTTGLALQGAQIGAMGYDTKRLVNQMEGPNPDSAMANFGDSYLMGLGGTMASTMGQESAVKPQSKRVFGENSYTENVAPYAEGVAMTGALAGVPTYMASRYYPIQTSMATDMAGDFAENVTNSPSTRVSRFMIPSLAIGAVGLGAGYAIDNFDQETYEKAVDRIPSHLIQEDTGERDPENSKQSLTQTKEANGPFSPEETGVAGLGAAGALTGSGMAQMGKSIEEGGDRFRGVTEEGERGLRNLRDIGDRPATTQSVDDYVLEGSRLIGQEEIVNPVTGNPFSGQDLMSRMREEPVNTVGRILNFPSPGSPEHYDAFSKGPIPAFSQLYNENLDEVHPQFMSATGVNRAEAARQTRDGGDFMEALTDQVQSSFNRDVPRSEARSFAEQMESTIRSQSPGLHGQGIEAMQSGRTEEAYDIMAQQVNQLTEGLPRASEWVSAGDVQNMNLVNKAQELGYDVSNKDELYALPFEDQEKVLTSQGSPSDLLRRFSSMQMGPVAQMNARRYSKYLGNPAVSAREATEAAAPYLRRSGYGLMLGAPLAGAAYFGGQGGRGDQMMGLNKKSSRQTKEAGGPGSGVSYDNTASIESLKKSPHITIHYRKKVMNHRSHDEKKDVDLDDIQYGAQEKYSIKKLPWFLENYDEWKEEPVDVALIDGEYHLMDGHHRFLAARRLGKDRHPAKVWVLDTNEINEVLDKAANDERGISTSNLVNLGAGSLALGIMGGKRLFKNMDVLRHGDEDLFDIASTGAFVSGPLINSARGKWSKEGSNLEKAAQLPLAATTAMGAAGGAGMNYLHQRSDMYAGQQERVNPYDLAQAGALGAGAGLALPVAARRTDDLLRRADETMQQAGDVMGDVEHTRRAMTEGAEEAAETARHMREVADEVRRTNDVAREVAEKARDNRFYGVFASRPDVSPGAPTVDAPSGPSNPAPNPDAMTAQWVGKNASKTAAAAGRVADAFVDWARKTDAPSPNQFQEYLQGVDGMQGVSVRTRPVRDVGDETVRFGGGGSEPGLWEVQTADGSFLLPGVDDTGEKLVMPDPVRGMANDERVRALKDVTPISKSETVPAGTVETEFDLPYSPDDPYVPPPGSDEPGPGDVLFGALALGGGGYAAHQKMKGEPLIPEGGSGSDLGKNAAPQGTIDMNAEDFAPSFTTDVHFDLAPGMQGQKFDFDMEMPDPIDMEMPDFEVPDGNRASAGAAPDPHTVDAPTPEVPEPKVKKPKQMVT